MGITNQENIYQTSDLACAAALSVFFHIESIDKADPRRAYFIFDRTLSFEVVLGKYQKQELRVEPRAYFDQIKALKTRLYEVN